MTAPLNNNSNGAFGFQIDGYVYPQFISGNRAPTTQDIYPPGTRIQDNSVSPPIIYVTTGAGAWLAGEGNPATTTTYGTVLLTDNSEPVATKAYADALAIAGAPVSTTTVAGIGQLATDAEAIAGTPSTGALALFVTPSNLAAVLAAAGPASFTDLTATGTVSFTGATGGYTITSATASSVGTTGAGIDLTLASAAGRVIVNGEEAAANAITLLSAAGGIDADAALQINIATSQNAADAMVLTSSAGGIDITAAGAAGEDIDITNTAGSIRLVAGESAADSIVLSSTIGGIDILANGASPGEDLDISTSASINITATENDAGAVIIRANGGTSERVTLLASQGTGADSINLESTAGGITLAAALASADAINLSASAGGVDIDGALQVNIASSQNAVDAIRIVASAGGIDIDAVGAATEDINITNTGGSVVVVATESVADAIRMNASGAAGGFDIDAGTNGFIVDTTGAVSLDAAAASNLTVTGAFALDVITTLGKLSLQSGQSAADSVEIKSLIGGIDILAAGASAGEDIDIIATGSSVNIRSTESATDAVVIESTLGGIQILASGAAAAEDILITATGSSVTITATENVTDAMNITASGAASRVNITAGTGSIKFASGWVVPITTKSNADTPYTVLGTDYVINCDTTAGVLQVTLPAATALAGRTFVIRDGAGTAAVNNITINGGGTNLVGGGASAATKVLSAAYSGATVYSNGTVWLYAYVA